MLHGTKSKGTNISKVEPCTEAQVLECSWCNICLWSNLAAKSKWDQDAKAGRLQLGKCPMLGLWTGLTTNKCSISPI